MRIDRSRWRFVPPKSLRSPPPRYVARPSLSNEDTVSEPLLRLTVPTYPGTTLNAATAVVPPAGRTTPLLVRPPVQNDRVGRRGDAVVPVAGHVPGVGRAVAEPMVDPRDGCRNRSGTATRGSSSSNHSGPRRDRKTPILSPTIARPSGFETIRRETGSPSQGSTCCFLDSFAVLSTR